MNEWTIRNSVSTIGPLGDFERFLVIYADGGKEVVRISMRTGKVNVTGPVDLAAQEFWNAVQRLSMQHY